jgi:hypothetical protein
MENRKRTEPFCSDTVNSLAKENKNFHWSTSYEWFLSKTVEEKKTDKLWITGLVNVGCVPVVFDCKELISWCAQRFDSRTRMIKLTTKGKNPVH